MIKGTVKADYLPGGAKREEAKKTAIKYLQAKIPVTQQGRHEFLTTVLKFTEEEYLELLNQAANEMAEPVWNS
jgi:NADH:ubiquinone oxidoreductase subunit B-like Fe-S oxidoreductase